MASESQHQITWWTSTFDHTRKVHRFSHDKILDYKTNYKIRFLHAPGYKKNVSVARLIDHRILAQKFKKQAQSEEKPDIILASLPTLELCLAAARYGEQEKVPVVLDIRDLWPDIFLELVPGFARFPAKIALAYLFSMARTACRKATAIVGLSPEFVDWGLRKAKRSSRWFDQVFPMGYIEAPPTDQEIEIAKRKIEALPIKDNDFVVCFFGTFGRQFDFSTVLAAAKELEKRQKPIKFVICGTGEHHADLQHFAESCRAVIVPGWLSRAEIWLLMRRSQLGLAPYVDSKNFRDNIPNKPIEYLSAGLPILLSIKGRLRTMLEKQNCGLFYENGSADSLISTLDELVENPSRLHPMRQQAHDLYRKYFIAEAVYSQMIEHLSLIAERFDSLSSQTYRSLGHLPADSVS